MTSLRRSILFLIVYLSILFNIERLDLGQVNLINISTLVYVLSFLSCITILFFPWMSRQKPGLLVGLWAALYLASRAALAWYIPRSPMLGGVYTYLTIAELALVIVAVLFSIDVARNLMDFDDAVRIITFRGTSQRVQTMEQASDEIQREVLRSRRHLYPFSVIVLEPDTKTVSLMLNKAVQEIQKSMMTHYALSDIVRIVSNLVRRTDLIIDQAAEKNNIIIFSPDTDQNSAALLKSRILNSLSRQIDVQIQAAEATFPEDALTFDELVKIAQEKMYQDTASVSEAHTGHQEFTQT